MSERQTNILVVDDEPGVVGILKDFLSVKGYEVNTALSGEQALEVLKQWNADLVILDIVMPGIKGTEVAKIVREKYPGTKIVIITAFPKESAELENAHTMEAMFIKPFKLQELCRKLEELLNQSMASGNDPGKSLPAKARILFIKADLLLVQPSQELFNFLRQEFAEKAWKGQYYTVYAASNEEELYKKLSSFRPDIVIFEESYLEALDTGVPRRIFLLSHKTKEVFAYDLTSTLYNLESLEKLMEKVRELCIKNGLIQIG